MMNTRKEEERNEEQIKKLALKHEELVSNMDAVEKKYSSTVEAAKVRGIAINNNPESVRKCEELRKKTDISRHHKSKTESLYKTKGELVVH